jgi:hypothetical protein
MTDSSQRELIADLARDLVAQTAPHELPLLPAVSSAYFKDPDKALKSRDGEDRMLGFGAEEVVPFLTPVALAVTTQVVTFVSEEVRKSVEDNSSSVIGELVKRMFKKFRPAGEDEKPPPLTPEQLARVRRLAIEKARQLNLPQARAELLADSMVGSLAVRS